MAPSGFHSAERPTLVILAVTGSLGLHGLLVGLAFALVMPRAFAQPEAPDLWTGTGVGLGYEVEVATQPASPGLSPAPPTQPDLAEPTPTPRANEETATAAPVRHTQRPPTPSSKGSSRQLPSSAGSMSSNQGHETAPDQGGTFGQEPTGKALGRPRNLVRALVRALPMASSGNPFWQSAEPGNAGSVVVTLSLDAQGHLLAPVFDRSKPEPPSHWTAMIRATMPLLQHGTFSVSSAEATAGSAQLRLTALVSVSEARPSDTDHGGAFGLGFDAPSPGAPGRAYFTLRSGKHVEISVELLATSPPPLSASLNSRSDTPP